MYEWNHEIAPVLYQPLEGHLPLRLLLIHPGRPDDPLRTELVPTTIDDAKGSYDATSYTWGLPENPESINCGGSQVWIQRNAFHMILDLRRPDKPRKIWIDAICINQCDLDERAAQVSIMHHIYRCASATWVWLGRPDESSSAVLRYAATLDAKKFVSEFSDCQYGTILAKFTEKSYFFDDSFNAGADANNLRDLATGIVDFLNRPWFSRVWIQQEASLSEKVQVVCGPDYIEWDNIFALAWIMCPKYTETWPDYIHQKLSRTVNNIQAVRIIQKARHYHFQETYGPTDIGLGFEGLINTVSRYEATDPRDRIFAMGNMIINSGEWFEVDYRIPWQILYTDIARRFINADALRFLQNAGRARQEPGTALPSWAPDYSYKEESEFMISAPALWKAGGSCHPALAPTTKASGSKVSPLPKGSRRQFPMSDEVKAFKGPMKSLLQSSASFRCLMSDEIIYIGEVVDTGTGTLEENIAQIVENIKKDIAYVGTLPESTYINGDTLLEAYKLTLIMACDAQQEIVGSDYVRAHWDEWFQWYEQGCTGYWDRRAPALNAAFESSGAATTFRFAVTRHGYFGLVPRPARAGDELAIFQSYELAVVLRRLPPTTAPTPPPPPPPLKAGKQTATAAVVGRDCFFELLGDAYVHGMMENEARCISDEFGCRHEPTQAQRDKMLRESDGGRGQPWATLSLSGHYERIFGTLGPRTVRLV
ncbi:putative heterokaryon incompatibility protein [Rosellinia necatrix]|uniref:Putative heterokaryon incompatibility protein n=1 Tax=Rosellinia necatrix TaxID=77044 RepID=A0A1W2TFT8_ROSNE|nr:putative heterokaryon incompatibility protein [Rosellinia necatrix]